MRTSGLLNITHVQMLTVARSFSVQQYKQVQNTVRAKKNVISTPTSSCLHTLVCHSSHSLCSLDSDFWHFEGGNQGRPQPSYDWSYSSGEHTPSMVPFLILSSKIKTVYWLINVKMGRIKFWAEHRDIIPPLQSWTKRIFAVNICKLHIFSHTSTVYPRRVRLTLLPD